MKQHLATVNDNFFNGTNLIWIKKQII